MYKINVLFNVPITKLELNISGGTPYGSQCQNSLFECTSREKSSHGKSRSM